MRDRSAIKIVEVGPRDGLQNESTALSVETKLELITRLAATGIRYVEATSFVNPNAVPQLADADLVLPAIDQSSFDRVISLVPNERGYDRALSAGARTIEIFTAATDEFCQANIRCTIDESFERFAPIMSRAKQDGVAVRGALSMAFVCPFTGEVDPEVAVNIAERLLTVGCYEVVICDTVGRAQPPAVEKLLTLAQDRLPFDQLALHMHDTFGLAIKNVQLGYDAGIRVFDSAIGGLGGCPFAPGAPGNIATEAVVRHFESHGVATGLNSDQLAEIGEWTRRQIG